MNTSALTLDACLKAIEVAKPFMTVKKFEAYKHAMRIAYIQSNLDVVNAFLAQRVIPTQLRNQALLDQAHWTSMMTKALAVAPVPLRKTKATK